jgi:hypothetical protein
LSIDRQGMNLNFGVFDECYNLTIDELSRSDMVAVREHFPKLTPAEYLDWEEQQERTRQMGDNELCRW